MLTYLLQVSTCWILFYGIFMLFLQKETFFSINRYYLMGALVSGLFIPLLGTFLPANNTSAEFYHVMTTVSEIEISPMIESQASVFTWLNLIFAIYILGAAIVFARFLFGISKIYTIYRKASKTKKQNYTLVESDAYHLPFSFFNLIFISKSLPINKDVESILKHEQLHVNQWHSIDIVFAELLQIFFWFNPILLFYKNALKQSHEFLADAYVTEEHKRSSYGQLLLRQSTSGLEIALANHFFQSHLKKRITMLYKEKSKRPAMVKYLAAIPVLIVLLILFASNTSDDTVAKDKDCMEITINNQGEIIYEKALVEITDLENELSSNIEKCILLNVKNDSQNEVVIPILDLAEKNNIDVRLAEEVDESLLIAGSQELFGLQKNVNFGKDQEQQGDPIFKVVEEMPRFPGCENVAGTSNEKEECAKKKMLEFIYNNIQYPQVARNQKIEGMTVIQFIIEKDGSIKEAKIVRDIGGNCGTESLRVVNSFPTWIPGKQKGKAVRVQYTLPVKYKLEGKTPVAEKKMDMPNIVALGNSNASKKKENLTQTNPSPQDREIFKVVEQMPRFPGCEDANITMEERDKCARQKMLEFIYTNLKYPKEARKLGIDGVAVIQMIVEKDGSIAISEIVRNPGGGTGEEAKRVVDQMPNWIPGKQRGKNVAVQYTLPVKYKLEGDTKTENSTIQNRTLAISIDQFKSIKSIKSIFKAAGISQGCNTNNYTLVHVAKKKDASVRRGKEDQFSQSILEVVSDAKIGDMYFFEDINAQCLEDKEAENKGGIAIKVISNDAKIDSKIAHDVDTKPLFPSTATEEESNSKLINFVFENISYPKDAIQNDIEGLVKVYMLIGADGKIHHVSLAESIGWGIDESVLSMVDKMKNMDALWTPATAANKNVNYMYVLPVKFKLQDNQREEVKSRKLAIPEMKISPNPSNGLFNLNFDIEDKTPVDILFYSANGALLKTIKQAQVPFNNSIDLTDYRGQTIFLNIIQKDKVYTDKVGIQ